MDVRSVVSGESVVYFKKLQSHFKMPIVEGIESHISDCWIDDAIFLLVPLLRGVVVNSKLQIIEPTSATEDGGTHLPHHSILHHQLFDGIFIIVESEF